MKLYVLRYCEPRSIDTSNRGFFLDKEKAEAKRDEINRAMFRNYGWENVVRLVEEEITL